MGTERVNSRSEKYQWVLNKNCLSCLRCVVSLFPGWYSGRLRVLPVIESNAPTPRATAGHLRPLSVPGVDRALAYPNLRYPWAFDAQVQWFLTRNTNIGDFIGKDL